MTNDILIKELQNKESEEHFVAFYRLGCLSEPLFITTKVHAEQLAKEILGQDEESVDITTHLLSLADSFAFKAMVANVDSLKEIKKPVDHEVRMVEEEWEPYVYTEEHGWEIAFDHVEREREEETASDVGE